MGGPCQRRPAEPDGMSLEELRLVLARMDLTGWRTSLIPGDSAGRCCPCSPLQLCGPRHDCVGYGAALPLFATGGKNLSLNLNLPGRHGYQ